MRPFVQHKYMFFKVKNSHVQSISQGLHFSMSYNGFGSGMKTLSPATLRGISAIYGHLSGHCESDLHQQCLALIILPPFRNQLPDL